MPTGSRRTAFALLRLSGLPLLLRRIMQRRRLTIILYHEIDAPTLDLHLSLLGERYSFVALRDYVVVRSQDRLEGLPPRALVVTLDDGLKSQYALLDVFREHGVVPTIFICSGIVGTDRAFWWTTPSSEEVEILKAVPDSERLGRLAASGYRETTDFPDRAALSLDEVRAMRASVDFQAHTVFHPILPQCTDEKAWAEISRSRAALEGDLGLDVYAFAYPNGDYSDREVGYLAQAGYACGVTTKAGFNDRGTSLFELKRICIPEGAGADEIVVRATGLASWLKTILRGVPR